MSQQARRLRDGAAADAKTSDLPSLQSMTTERFKALEESLYEGIVAIQSTDYVGCPDAQAHVNQQHDRMQKRSTGVRTEINRRAQ